MTSPDALPKSRRRIYLVRSSIQVKMLLPLLFTIFMFGLVTCYFLYTWMQKVVDTTLLSQTEIEDFQKQVWLILSLLGATILLGCGTLFVSIILLTHKIAGPLVSIGRFIDALVQGNHDIPDLGLRERDDLKDIASKLNQLKSYLKSLAGRL